MKSRKCSISNVNSRTASRVDILTLITCFLPQCCKPQFVTSLALQPLQSVLRKRYFLITDSNIVIFLKKIYVRLQHLYLHWWEKRKYSKSIPVCRESNCSTCDGFYLWLLLLSRNLCFKQIWTIFEAETCLLSLQNFHFFSEAKCHKQYKCHICISSKISRILPCLW